MADALWMREQKMRKSLRILIVAVLLALAVSPLAVFGDQNDPATAAQDEISIIFTGDMHSHLSAQDGWGGFAKLKTTIDDIQTSYPDSFLLDAGDFSMGTPYQTIFMSQAAELRMMGLLRYDAVALGNHEFDYRPAGLTKMLTKASEYKGTGTEYIKVYNDAGYYHWEQIEFPLMPQLIQSNIDWTATLAEEDLAPAATKLKAAMDLFGVLDYTIIEKQGVRMAVFSVMGPEAISQAPEAGVLWEDYIARAKALVAEIKQNGEADLIVCLSHAGYYESSGEEAEDIQLAREVPDIDVILSGHSHESLDQELIEGKTIIVGCGAYSDHTGHLVLKKDGTDYTVAAYDLIPMDETVAEDPAVLQATEDFKDLVNREYFNKYGFSYDGVIAKNTLEFTPVYEFGSVQREEPLGNLITDAYIYAVKQAEGTDYVPVDVAVVPKGVVRASLAKGDVTAADAFNISSLGIGKDGVPGYPLVSVYLTGRELKAAAEVDASVSVLMNEARLYFSGLSYTINSKRLLLNRATDIRLVQADGTKVKLDNDKLYRVVADLYTCQMLGLVKEGSYGLLSVTPKDKDGNVITNFEDHLIYDGNQELKAWYAVASYIDGFEGNKIPDVYGEPQGRKVLDDSYNPVKLLKQPNHIGLMAAGIILIPIVIIVGIILFIRSRVRRRRGYEKSIFSARAKGYDKPKMKIRRMKRYKSKF
jgi:2',3'-cyclic-nucleotide 2'-phosphodiesterase (5'-nucleotidase family)